MNRRSLFKLAACAIAASAMEVMGWEGVSPKVGAWEDAAYEMVLIFHPKAGKPIGAGLLPAGKPNDYSPTGERFDRVDGKWVSRGFHKVNP